MTPPSVSKRLAALESRLGVRLLNRTTRRISLTPEGETYLVEGSRIMSELESLEQLVSGARSIPKGLLKISATLGFGRRQLTPLLSKFAERYPDIEVQLHLSDRPVNLVEQGFDAAVRFGELRDARVIARRLADNRRLLCAAPAYLKRHGVPASPRDLQKHKCIFIRESDEVFGTWHFHSGSRHEAVKVRGQLSANDGESALSWALDGHGILVRSEWDTAPYLRSGRLKPLLEDWSLPAADVYLVYPARTQLSAKTRALTSFLLEAFQSHRAPNGSGGNW